MKKLFTFVTAAFLSVATLAQAASVNYQDTTHKTKTGKLDRRYNANKHLKKDGTMDMRYKSSKKVASKTAKDTTKKM
ncbi:hypothetical protein [Mucilaginibacter phyllosphaerae]